MKRRLHGSESRARARRRHRDGAIARRAGAVALGLLAAISFAPSSAAAGDPSIQRTGQASFPERSYILQLPASVALDPGDVAIRENGELVEAVEVTSTAAASQGQFASVLVIDASRSMRGRPIEEAMRAARAFAQHRAPEQGLAVIAFNDRPRVLLPFTTDEAEIAEALARPPRVATSTHLYEGASSAVQMLGDAGIDAGSVVMLSDGADNGSDSTLRDVAALAADGGVRVFAVGLRSPQFDPRTLERLAIDGAYANARRPQDLARIFDRFGSELASDYLVRYRSPAEPGEQVTVEAQVEGVPEVARASYVAPSASSPGEAATESSGFWGSAAAMIASAAVAALLLGLALAAVLRPRPKRVKHRLAGFVRIGATEEEGRTPTPDGRPSSGLLAAFERSLDGGDRWTRFKEELDVAGIQVPAIRLAAGTLLGTVVATVLIGGATGYAILAPLGLVIPWAVRAIIGRRLRSRRDLFADQLPDNLQVVASAIRAGHSMIAAFALMVDEASDPARREFRRIVNDERLGVPLDDAIRDVARRMDNRDMEQLALVATIQRETGGNTAEILDRVIENIRERGELRRLMETLTAQGRLSRAVVSAIPVVLLVAVSIINPDYLRPLFETTTGQFLLGVAAALVITGSLVIKRIVDVRV